ncbi:MAG: hypothetical protein AAGF93_00030 [Cyanobacteria bacterium P01_H01_bin.105]
MDVYKLTERQKELMAELAEEFTLENPAFAEIELSGGDRNDLRVCQGLWRRGFIKDYTEYSLVLGQAGADYINQLLHR